MKVLIIDNYDSFTFNLYQLTGEVLYEEFSNEINEIIVKRNDEVSLSEIKKNNFNNIIISPGPGSPVDDNYFGISMLKKLENKVGYSDHTFGIEGTKISLEYEPYVIEKHFTTDQSLPGRDNKFAILPHELKELSDYIKMREEMNISHGGGYLECEQEARDIMTGRFDG